MFNRRKNTKNNDLKYDPFLRFYTVAWVNPGTILHTGPSTYNNETHSILQSPNQLEQAVKERNFFF